MHTREGREIKALRKRIEFLQADLNDAAKELGNARNEIKKWRDKYAMLMSVAKPFVKKFLELEQ